MTPAPCVIDESLSVADAMDRMLANNIRHLVVVSNKQAVGVVDAADLSLAVELSSQSNDELLLKKAKRRLFQCSPHMPLTTAIKTMERDHITCTVVVDQGRVVGIFTTSDALRALRQLVHGHPVAAQNVPTHQQPIPATRENTPPRARARRVVAAHNATPSASDGMAFGSVGI